MDVLFQIWRPDEVAECLEGVNEQAYKELWALVPLYDHVEPSYPGEINDDVALSRFWHKLTPETRAHLDEMANLATATW